MAEATKRPFPSNPGLHRLGVLGLIVIPRTPVKNPLASKPSSPHRPIAGHATI